MFNQFKSDLKIVSPDGAIRSVERGLVDRKSIIIENTSAVILVGDEIRRTLDNGTEESFEVLDPICFTGPLAHYEVKYRRKGTQPRADGHLTFNVSGQNARINFGSTDHSHNVISSDRVFVELRNKIREAVLDPAERARIVDLIENMENARNDRSAYMTAYQNFVASAAAHMTVIAPFLPAITQLLS
jgi:hypothetical protein